MKDKKTSNLYEATSHHSVFSFAVFDNRQFLLFHLFRSVKISLASDSQSTLSSLTVWINNELHASL